MMKHSLNSAKNWLLWWPCSKSFKNLFLLLLTVFSLLISGTVGRAADASTVVPQNQQYAGQWFVSNFLNTGLSGVYVQGHYTNLANDRIMVNEISDCGPAVANYPVDVQVSQPQKLGGPTVIGGTQHTYTLPDGTTQYYQWQEQDYEFEVLAYTQLKVTDVLSTKSGTENHQWFKYYYGYYKDGNPWGDYGYAKYPLISDDCASFTFSAPVFVTDPTTIGNSLGVNFDAKVGIAIGQDLTFQSVIPKTDGSLVLNGTAYFIDQPVLEHTKFQTGYVTQEIQKPEFPDGQFSPSTDQVFQQTMPAQPSPPKPSSDLSGAPLTFVTSAAAQIAQVINGKSSSPGKLQTTPTYDNGYDMVTGDGTQLKGNYQPDSKMLPNSNTFCYISVPVNFQPVAEWQTYQFTYNQESCWAFKGYGTCFCEYYVLKNTAQSTPTSDNTYAYAANVENVYSLTTIKVPVKFATIYNWEPAAQGGGEPATPPIDKPIPPTYTPTVSGQQNVTVTGYNTPNPLDNLYNDLINSIVGILTIVIIGVVIVGMLIVVIALAKKLSSTNATAARFNQMGLSNWGAPQMMLYPSGIPSILPSTSVTPPAQSSTAPPPSQTSMATETASDTTSGKKSSVVTYSVATKDGRDLGAVGIYVIIIGMIVISFVLWYLHI